MAPENRTGPGAAVLALLLLLLLPMTLPAERLIESFGDLEDWKEVSFRKIERGSEFEALRNGDLLRVRSRGGASMLVLEEEIDVYETPVVSWRWRVTEDLARQDLRRQDGDDAAIRLYIAFRRPLSERGFGERFWAQVQESVYGEIPPDSALSFVWSSRYEGAFLSPYTDKQYLVVPEIEGEGAFAQGEWIEHRVDLLETYRALFGEEPPAEAFVALMGDSDNTGGRTEAWLDYLKFTPR